MDWADKNARNRGNNESEANNVHYLELTTYVHTVFGVVGILVELDEDAGTTAHAKRTNVDNNFTFCNHSTLFECLNYVVLGVKQLDFCTVVENMC